MVQTESDSGRRWRSFFVFFGAAGILLTAISIVLTTVFNLSVPPDCPSCGMAAVGLVPVYLITAVMTLTLAIGFVIWVFRRRR
ncbi:hypothetical protein LK09_03950 [Microbacterium mangrovi]|uniref:Uncharacterized protein n=1 Tax=Microbacterium mangrovi TaxID=1348253 RepID=A0A0B2ABN4_9MICO|nr:hypothetical protein [Microbacterium mangrovi]KHK99168.1 hypothetical protein LK09_03950 [Microbacterium mangrovi]